jgi:hypothetical protein
MLEYLDGHLDDSHQEHSLRVSDVDGPSSPDESAAIYPRHAASIVIKGSVKEDPNANDSDVMSAMRSIGYRPIPIIRRLDIHS